MGGGVPPLGGVEQGREGGTDDQAVARARTAPPRYTALAAPAAKSLSVGLNQEEIATKNSKNIPSKLNSQELPKLINTFQKIESK